MQPRYSNDFLRVMGEADEEAERRCGPVVDLRHGDCRAVLPTMAAGSVDAVVTDPPYGLSFMGKRWDYDVPSADTWREVLRVMKPGAHLLCFGGARTYHRVACAIEDAGFEIRDCVMWVYGSGFPKSLDVGKALDKAAGAEREVIGSRISSQPTGNAYAQDRWTKEHRKAHEVAITAPATELASRWEGWGTALKPAHEPIVLARKPLDGTVASNVQAHGTGALNIDACRVATSDKLGGGAQLDAQSAKPEGWDRPWRHDPLAQQKHAERIRANVAKAESLGRWPANLIHDGSDEVLGLFPEASGPDRRGNPDGRRPGGFGDVGADNGDTKPNAAVYADAGSAARFFYCAKASRSDRGDGNNHPTVKPQALMRYLTRLVTPPGGLILDPFAGSGSTGLAALAEGFRFIGIEREVEYVEIARQRVAEVA